MADFEVTTLDDEAFNGGSLAEETADGGGLSLREAIALANADPSTADIITFAAGGTALLDFGGLEISGNVTINGDVDGDGVTDVTVDAQGNFGYRPFSVYSGDVTLHALTLTGGYYLAGAGLLVQGAGANVTLSNSIVTGNETGNDGSFVSYFGGGIAVYEGTLSVEQSLIRDNTSGSYYNASGGGIYVGANGNLTLTNSTVTGNSVVGSTSNFAGSSVTTGGGIAVRGGTVELVHTTVTNNTVSDGSFYDFNNFELSGLDGQGGGIFATGASSLSLVNSLVVGNSGTVGANIAGTVDSEEGSLTDGDESLVFDGSGLADNGGPVQTIALINDPSNPALDLGAAQPGTEKDANGNTRNVDDPDVDNGGTADAGAVEVLEEPSLVVTTAEDIVDSADGVTSLREAIAFANSDADASTITFDLGSDDTTIRLTQTLEITNALTIDGGGVVTITGDVDGDDTVVDGVTVLAETDAEALDDNVQLFALNGADADTTFSGLTLTGGVAAGNGGAVSTLAADITLVDSVVSGNQAGNNGGGIFNFGGATTVTDSTIGDNTAGQEGGGIFAKGNLDVTGSTLGGNTAGTDGGGIYADVADGGTVAVSATEFVNNTATEGGGGLGGTLEGSSLTIDGSTFAGNTASNGAAVRVDLNSEYLGFDIDAGINEYGPASSADVTNSTFVGNVGTGAGYSSTVTFFGETGYDQAATVNQSTFTGNTNTLGFNVIQPSAYANLIEVTVSNSIVLGNTNDDVNATDQGGGVLSAGSGYSVEDVFADVVDGAGVLADNGGVVQTVALLASATNPALDAASPIGGYDARGFIRGVNILGDDTFAQDLGAFELQASEALDGPLVVTNLSDGPMNFLDGELTLREAIFVANENDDPNTITFADDLSGVLRLSGDRGTLELRSDVEIDGDGRIILSGDVDGNDVLRDGLTDLSATDQADLNDNITVFQADTSDLNITLRNITVTGGRGSYGAFDAYNNANVEVIDSHFEGNSSTGSYGGGAIYSEGTLTVTGSTFVGNRSYGSYGGGAIHTRGGGLSISDSVFEGNEALYTSYGGGAIFANRGGTLTDLTLTGNTSDAAGGAIFGNGSDPDSSLSLTNVTIADNSADQGGGGLASNGNVTLTNSTVANNTAGTAGGGLYVSGDDNTFTNTTIANNTAGGQGGAIGIGSGGFTADHVTITGNRAQVVTDLATGTAVMTSSGAVYQGGSGGITFTNSLVIGNSAGSDGSQFVINDTLENIDGGNNIIDADAAADVFAQTATFSDATGTTFFGVLADNGGPVQTVALLADAGNAALDGASGSGPAQDARGRDRSDFAGLGLGIADIGAFELINDAPMITSAATFTAAENQTAVGTVAASDDVDTGLTFAIETGADGALFVIDGATGALRFADAPNFEAPADADGDNVYEVQVSVSDGTFSDVQTVSVTVTDVIEALTITTLADGGTTTGSDEGDIVTGNTGNDVINAGLGDDIIVDTGGDDIVDAGGGDDRVGLLSGMNSVSGGDGADLIVGGFGNDTLSGDAGMDVIRGDVSTNLAGSDRIDGGAGNDLLEGRGGADTFVFGAGDGADTIGALEIDYVTPANTTVTGADFVSGVDRIELEGFGFTDGAAALAAVTDVNGVATFSSAGTVITFAGLTADDLSADDFILV